LLGARNIRARWRAKGRKRRNEDRRTDGEGWGEGGGEGEREGARRNAANLRTRHFEFSGFSRLSASRAGRVPVFVLF